MKNLRGSALTTCIQVILLSFFLIITHHSPGAAQSLHFQGTHILAYDTMAKLAIAYQQQTGIDLLIKGGGCADGVVGVTRDKFEMGGLCCPLKNEEKDRLNLVVHPVARDIKAVIVHPSNPLDTLTAEQLKELHQGTITSWQELGWVDKPIAVIYRKHCLDRQEPVRIFLELDDKLNRLAPKVITVRTDKEIIDYVSQFPTAIGITSNVFVKGNNGLKTLKIDGIAPTSDNVEVGLYSFTAILSIVTKGKPDKKTRRFLDFVVSEKGQSIVKENLAGIR